MSICVSMYVYVYVHLSTHVHMCICACQCRFLQTSEELDHLEMTLQQVEALLIIDPILCKVSMLTTELFLKLYLFIYVYGYVHVIEYANGSQRKVVESVLSLNLVGPQEFKLSHQA